MKSAKARIRFLSLSLVLLTTLIVVSSSPLFADQNSATEDDRETEFLAILQSDAPKSAKAIACKNLAIYGSSDSVPELEKLLPDPQLSSWARIALEAIPGSAADRALRSAASSLQGRLLIGMINSIGNRRDANAVDLLTAKLSDPDSDVASAAAVALGQIGNSEACNSLKMAMRTAPIDVRSAVAEGYVLCAERRIAEGNSAAAVEIYDEIRGADVPVQRIIEATRGAILARNQDGIPLLIDTLKSPNKKLFQLALGTIREFPGNQVDAALAGELDDLEPQRASMLIQAMADRPQTVILATILKSAKQGDLLVRLSAIDALRRVGDESCLDSLLTIAVDSNEELAKASTETLADLPGDNVDQEIAALLPEAEGDTYRLLIQLIGQRRIELVEQVEKALAHRSEPIRHSALVALGDIVSLDKLDILVNQAVSPEHLEDAAVARQSLRKACIRMPDREECAAELTKALDRAPADAKTTLMEILSDVGGPKALQTLARAAKSSDPQMQDAGSRLLGKWNGVDAAPILLDLAKTGPVEKYRIRALRGYIGLARKFSMSGKQRAEMCRNALDATSRLAEHKLVLDVLKLHPSVHALKLAIKSVETPGLKDDATQAAYVIAQKVAQKGGNVRQLMTGLEMENVDLEIIDAQYGAGSNQKKVTSQLRKQAGNSPLITLASAGYNASFGGDPAPGVPKKLKIKYRINGKIGEASFDENALIILPTPK